MPAERERANRPTTGRQVPVSWTAPDLAGIQAYYEETWLDYRLLWLNPTTCAMHFGYWDEATQSHAEALLNMNRALANRIGLQRGQRVLDAGCGVGGSAIWLAKEYGVDAVGITLVPSQIARARRYARAHGVAAQVRFEQQDYTQSTFPDASFEVVWVMESVCHAADKRLFLAEARRLLRPGGRLGIVDYFRREGAWTAADEELQHSWLSGWAVPDLATGGEFLRWTREAGFTDVQLVDIGAHVWPSSRRLYWLARLLWPLALGLRAVGLRSERQLGNIRGARDQYRAMRRGLWFEGTLTATASTESVL